MKRISNYEEDTFKRIHTSYLQAIVKLLHKDLEKSTIKKSDREEKRNMEREALLTCPKYHVIVLLSLVVSSMYFSHTSVCVSLTMECMYIFVHLLCCNCNIRMSFL